jgi:hypothetical protein
MSAEPDRQHSGLYGSDGDERTEDDCPATFPAIGLECALMTGHDNGWHWDPRGVDWREQPGIEPPFGQPAAGAAVLAHAAEPASRLPAGAAELIGDLPVFVTAQPAYSRERARLVWLMAYGVLSPEDKVRWEELRRPEVAAVKAVIDRELTDEVIRPVINGPAMTEPPWTIPEPPGEPG